MLPLDATSVAIRIERDLLLNLFKEPSLVVSFILPKSGIADRPRFRIKNVSRCELLHVFVNTINVLPASLMRMYAK